MTNLFALVPTRQQGPTAEKEFAQAVALEPNSVDAHLDHAFALEGLRNKDGTHRVKDALAEYEAVLKLRPEHPDAVFGEASAYAGELKDLNKANDLLSKYLQLSGALPQKDKATQLQTVVKAKLAAGVGSQQPKAAVQLCIVHMVRNSLNYVGWNKRDKIGRASCRERVLWYV